MSLRKWLRVLICASTLLCGCSWQVQGSMFRVQGPPAMRMAADTACLVTEATGVSVVLECDFGGLAATLFAIDLGEEAFPSGQPGIMDDVDLVLKRVLANTRWDSMIPRIRLHGALSAEGLMSADGFLFSDSESASLMKNIEMMVHLRTVRRSGNSIALFVVGDFLQFQSRTTSGVTVIRHELPETVLAMIDSFRHSRF